MPPRITWSISSAARVARTSSGLVTTTSRSSGRSSWSRNSSMRFGLSSASSTLRVMVSALQLEQLRHDDLTDVLLDGLAEDPLRLEDDGAVRGRVPLDVRARLELDPAADQ